MNARKLVLGSLVACLLAAGLLIWSSRPKGPSTLVRFQVRKGVSARDVAKDLQQAGLLHHPWSFLLWPKLNHHKAIRPGIYEIPATASGYDIYRQLIRGPVTIRITFPEGWTAKQMAALAESRGITTANDFLAIVDKSNLEGTLFPDTYFFEQGLPADQVIARMTSRFKEKEPSDFLLRAKAMKLSERQLITLASLVEREARAPQERPIIAGVFLNRLHKHWLLESCATVEYALGAWKPHLTYKDLDVKSPYNTYRHPGLPPGPICNPGQAALDAAAHPAKTDMMFFVADGQGTHRFSKYYQEHLNAQRKKK